VDGRFSTVNDRLGAIEINLASINKRLEADGSRLTNLENCETRARTRLNDQWRHISDQNRRLDVLISEARRRLPAQFDSSQIERLSEEAESHLNALYLSFEDRYRGSREDIRRRQSFYLSYLQAAATRTGKLACLDVGCGRGEFLELLKSAGLEPQGLDLNSVMVEECKRLGLEANLGDAVDYMRALPEGSLAAVSAFHLVEHLPFDRVIVLIDEALRALVPGGVLILETPNPANLLVAAERFYYDPTHRNPLPSEMLSFMVEARGFVDVQVNHLHPVDAEKRSYDDPMLALLQDKIYGPQDYGIVATRPV
jgi:O-antigen chain-terminating methyltransferase